MNFKKRIFLFPELPNKIHNSKKCIDISLDSKISEPKIINLCHLYNKTNFLQLNIISNTASSNIVFMRGKIPSHGKLDININVSQNSDLVFVLQVCNINKSHEKIHVNSTQGKNSSLKCILVHSGAGDSYIDVNSDLNGSKSNIWQYILLNEKKHSKVDLRIKNSMHSSHSNNSIRVRNIIQDKVLAQIQGDPIILNNVHSSTTDLDIKTLMIGRDSRINILPMLDIQSCNITASHSSSLVH